MNARGNQSPPQPAHRRYSPLWLSRIKLDSLPDSTRWHRRIPVPWKSRTGSLAWCPWPTGSAGRTNTRIITCDSSVC